MITKEKSILKSVSNIFPILAIETSGELCSVAVLIDINTFSEMNVQKKHIHSEKIFSIIDSVLKESDLAVSDLKSIAVSMGPGSFTGLRIGLTAAKGIALGQGLPLIPVSTYGAMSFQIRSFNGLEESFIIANKVNREEVYFSKITKRDSLKNPTIKLINVSSIIGSNLGVNTIFGNSSLVNIENSIASPNAYFVGKWAYIFGEDLLTYDYDYLEPNYLKNFVAKVKK
ncbi:MAG: tRNA (adenosine(37)-N6)-threonylcarbamoyltransferase complex dimerization subunit type 1 TsaB [Bacteroidetes bacterium]|nr:tRNA (adenosine(37)-N6)-threonylcarbamoyltransferase complex dimerization subunit type 1 TsaB [Bacteroidota bacterium]MBU1678154.1 tRNA (adenosine(37)-N6)-threonylcarbamoyltransferase complex dimerization subunit type 1 TsaB [Bacteroidota bacterium]MBU2506700.1 tRNA (adenosine(37)-N6)-threonylcarbamoyltransferase complex dimerization subunit type 1 TsaB [Bacteroidota bacterium]